MKRIMVFLVTISLIVSMILMPSETNTASSNSALKQESIRLDVKESHASESEVVFTVKVPQDVAQVVLDSLKLEHGLSIKRGSVSFNSTSRELKFTVLGKKVVGKKQTVIGLNDRDGRLFTANPYNAVCRYSDGKKWQINTRRLSDLASVNVDYVSTSSRVPTDPPTDSMREVAAVTTRTLNVNSTYFFDDYEIKNGKPIVKGNPIDRKLVDPTSLEVPTNAVFTYGTTDKSQRIIFPNAYNPKNPTIGVAYNMSSSGIYLDDMYSNPLPPSSPDFLTGHAGCWKYLVNYQHYIVASTIPQDSYEYKGNVTFDYIPYGKATLVGNLKADPTSVQFKGNDVIVDLILEGEVVNIEDPRALDYYLLYVRLADGTMISDPKGDKIVANGKATVKKTYKYTISKSRLSSTSVKDLTQEFAGRVRGFYKKSSYYTGELDSGLKEASVYVYKEPPPVQTPPPTTGPQKQPPVAVINGMSEVKLGDYTSFNGYDSYDPDGTIEGYRWVMPGARETSVEQDKYDITYADATAWYDKLGPQRVLLYVKDNDGMQAGTYHSFVVVEPTIEASIQQSGTLKENRKVTLREWSNTPAKYPVITEKTTWTIESMYGDIPATQIKYNGSLRGKKEVDVLFKQAGEYLVTLSVENTAGYKDTVSRVITIKPDEAPVVDFTFQQKVYRDPSNNNLATFELTDSSYSVDGDPIVSRKWYVVYDANNDGVFNEPRVLFNNGNNTEVTYQTNKVGKYAFYLEVQEEFGQPTIEQFVTHSDRRISRTW